jgi:hypothetical protein
MHLPKKVDPIRSNGGLQMQCDTPRIKRWERPNLVHNVVEKTSKSRRKKGMIGHANNQVHVANPTNDFKHVQCESESK